MRKHRLCTSAPADARDTFPAAPTGRQSHPFELGTTPPQIPLGLASTMLDLLDVLSLGVVLVDRGLFCHFANRAAREMLRSGPIMLDETRLVCAPPDSIMPVQRAVQQAIAAAGNSRVAAETVTLPAEPEALRIVVGVMGTMQPRVAALFVSPPVQARQSDIGLLRRLFGFTRLEAEVAELLCRNQNPEEIGRALHLSPHTVRAHLRNAFAKSGARRQAELVGLVLSSAGALRFVVSVSWFEQCMW
jgi:DNA-binding CsgD family transcriptional regulator